MKKVLDQTRFFEDLLDQLPGLFFILDDRGRYVRWNKNTEKVLGYSADELMHKPGIDLVCLEDRQRVTETIVEVLRFSSGTVEYRKVTKDGREIPILAQAIRMEVGGEQLIVGVQMDISARKAAEAQLVAYQEGLRSLASRLSFAEEAERRRIAVGLHDSAAQNLAVAVMKLDALTAEAGCFMVADNLKEVRALVEEAATELRSLALDLSPPELFEIGLGAALESLVERFVRERGVDCSYQAIGDDSLVPRDARSLIFRCASELLANVAKHAEATQVLIQSRCSDDRIEVIVSDDGLGFEVSEGINGPDPGGGFGLFSIRERMLACGGAVKITSKPGEGARVVLSLSYGESSSGGNR